MRCVSSRWTRSDADPWICWLILQHPLPFGPEQVPNRLCSRRRRAQLRVHCWAHGCLPNRENVSAAQPMTSPPYPFSSPVEPTLCPFLSEPATLRGGAGTQATLDVHARRETTCCVARQGLTHTADHQLARRCSACGVASSNGRPTDVCVGGCRGPPGGPLQRHPASWSARTWSASHSVTQCKAGEATRFSLVPCMPRSQCGTNREFREGWSTANAAW